MTKHALMPDVSVYVVGCVRVGGGVACRPLTTVVAGVSAAVADCTKIRKTIRKMKKNEKKRIFMCLAFSSGFPRGFSVRTAAAHSAL